MTSTSKCHILKAYKPHHLNYIIPFQNTLTHRTSHPLNSVLQSLLLGRKDVPSHSDSCSQSAPKLRGSPCFFITPWVYPFLLAWLYLPVFRCWMVHCQTREVTSVWNATKAFSTHHPPPAIRAVALKFTLEHGSPPNPL